MQYYALRARANLQLIEKLDLIGQTSEFARVFGIEFYHVLSRGTQVSETTMGLSSIFKLTICFCWCSWNIISILTVCLC